MEYNAIVTREGKHWLATFPDAPGCQTFADSLQELQAAALEALEGWLESSLANGDTPPRPRVWSRRRRTSHKLITVTVSPSITVSLVIRWTRQELGMSQAQLARRLGVTQQRVAKLENPDANPSLKTIESAARALGIRFDLRA